MYDDQQVKEILLANGYIDITSDKNKLKGKTRLRHPSSKNKCVFFDYINICILQRFNIVDSETRLSYSELKALIFYFNLPYHRQKTFISDMRFSFKKFTESIDRLRKDIYDYEFLGISDGRRKQLEDRLKEFEETTFIIPSIA